MATSGLLTKLEVRRMSLSAAQHRLDRQRHIIEAALRSLRMGAAECEVRGALEAKGVRVGGSET